MCLQHTALRIFTIFIVQHNLTIIKAYSCSKQTFKNINYIHFSLNYFLLPFFITIQIIDIV